MTILLAIYLGGWIGASSVAVSRCEPARAISKTECKVIASLSGAIWPVATYRAVTE